MEDGKWFSWQYSVLEIHFQWLISLYSLSFFTNWESCNSSWSGNIIGSKYRFYPTNGKPWKTFPLLFAFQWHSNTLAVKSDAVPLVRWHYRWKPNWNTVYGNTFIDRYISISCEKKATIMDNIAKINWDAAKVDWCRRSVVVVVVVVVTKGK